MSTSSCQSRGAESQTAAVEVRSFGGGKKKMSRTSRPLDAIIGVAEGGSRVCGLDSSPRLRLRLRRDFLNGSTGASKIFFFLFIYFACFCRDQASRVFSG